MESVFFLSKQSRVGCITPLWDLWHAIHSSSGWRYIKAIMTPIMPVYLSLRVLDNLQSFLEHTFSYLDSQGRIALHCIYTLSYIRCLTNSPESRTKWHSWRATTAASTRTALPTETRKCTATGVRRNSSWSKGEEAEMVTWLTTGSMVCCGQCSNFLLFSTSNLDCYGC